MQLGFFAVFEAEGFFGYAAQLFVLSVELFQTALFGIRQDILVVFRLGKYVFQFVNFSGKFSVRGLAVNIGQFNAGQRAFGIGVVETFVK